MTALPAKGAHLIVCHGGSVHQSHTTLLPCYKPFSKLVSDMLASAPTCTAPDLPLVVHALPEDYGTVSESVVFGYPSDGSIVRGREKLSFGVSHDGAHIALRSGPESELSVLFEGGTTVCAQIRPHPTSTTLPGAMDAVSAATEEVRLNRQLCRLQSHLQTGWLIQLCLVARRSRLRARQPPSNSACVEMKKPLALSVLI